MKSFLLSVLTLTSLNAFSQELEDHLLRTKVTDTINEYFMTRLDLSGDVGYGYLEEHEFSIKVENFDTSNGELKLRSTGIAYTYDNDFGDPVDEVQFSCISASRKVNGIFEVLSIECEY